MCISAGAYRRNLNSFCDSKFFPIFIGSNSYFDPRISSSSNKETDDTKQIPKQEQESKKQLPSYSTSLPYSTSEQIGSVEDPAAFSRASFSPASILKEFPW